MQGYVKIWHNTEQYVSYDIVYDQAACTKFRLPKGIILEFL